MKIRFVNFELGFGSSFQRLQGWTNGTYGQPSKFDAQLGGQVVEVEVASEREYLTIIKEVKDAYHMPLRKWVPIPDFSVAVEANEEARTFKINLKEVDAGVSSSLPFGIRPLPEVNPSMKYPSLKSIAKKEGAWHDGLKGNQAVVDAILTKRGQPKAA